MLQLDMWLKMFIFLLTSTSPFNASFCGPWQQRMLPPPNICSGPLPCRNWNSVFILEGEREGRWERERAGGRQGGRVREGGVEGGWQGEVERRFVVNYRLKKAEGRNRQVGRERGTLVILASCPTAHP